MRDCNTILFWVDTVGEERWTTGCEKLELWEVLQWLWYHDKEGGHHRDGQNSNSWPVGRTNLVSLQAKDDYLGRWVAARRWHSSGRE